MTECPYCSTEIVDDLNFCISINCEKQVKCLNVDCGAFLYKDREKCLKCGDPLKVSTAQSAINILKIEERTTKTTTFRKVDFQGTDSSFIAAASNQKLIPERNIPFERPPIVKQETDPSLPSLLENNPEVSTLDTGDPTIEEKRVAGEQKASSENTSHKIYFVENAEHGVFPNKTLRAQLGKLPSSSQQQQVFLVLYAWAHYRETDAGITRDQITKVMRAEGIYDGSNSRTYIKKVIKDYFVLRNGQFFLADHDGEERVKEIIEDFQKPVAKTASASSKSKSSSSRPKGKMNKAELEKVQPWLEKPLVDNVKNFDVRTLSSSTQWAIFGLYILTKVLEEEEAVKAGILYVFLKEKYKSMSYSRDDFVKNMNRSKKLSRNIEGNYTLPIESEQEVEKLLGIYKS